MKATERYSSVVRYIMLCKVALTVTCVAEILKCDHSTEQYFSVVLFIMLYEVALILSLWIKS